MDSNVTVDQGGDPVIDSDPDLEVRCGYGKCKPRWLQKLNNSKLLLALLCIFTTVQGPEIEYIVGGQFLNIYVDFDRVDLDSITTTTSDPRWVGAWWLGSILSCGLFLIIVIPLFAFGAELPTARSVRETRVSQTYKDDGKLHDGSENEAISIRTLPAALCRLLRNPTHVCITFAGATVGIITSGMATFLPKFIQNQYNLSPSYAAILTGVAVVPGAAGGNFVGGLVCRCMRLKVKGMTRFSFIGCFLTALSFTVLFLICEQSKMVFSNCSCVAVQPGQNTSMVTTETCQSNCNLLYGFLPIMSIAIFFTFLPTTPNDSALLRCTHDGDRTFGIWVRWFIIRMAGTIPGPILFGSITDVTCTLWSEKCGEKTSCWLYDNDALAPNYFLLIMGVKIFSFVLFLLAHLLYVPPQSDVLHVLNENGEQEIYKTGISNNILVTDNDDVNSDGNSIMSHQNSIQTLL